MNALKANKLRFTGLLLGLAMNGAAGETGQAGPEQNGAMLFANNCANCHGVYGEGDGVISPSLSVAVQDLKYLAQRNGGIFPAELVNQIVDGRLTRAAHGPEGMPVWGAVFTQAEGTDAAAQDRVRAKITSLVEFLAALQVTDPPAE